MEKYEVAICLNILLIVLEIVALMQCWDALGCIDFVYYTIDSNIFLLISSILYLISRKNIPKIVQLAKYSSTLSVLITFLVVLLVLYPAYDFNFQFLFFEGPNLLMHVLCPIIAFISFTCFEEYNLENNLRNNFRALYFTIIYAILLLALNIQKIVVGPYPFFKVYTYPVLSTILMILGILIGALILSRLLVAIQKLNQIN